MSGDLCFFLIFLISSLLTHVMLSFWDEQYSTGNYVTLWSDKAGPRKNPQVWFPYDHLPICTPNMGIAMKVVLLFTYLVSFLIFCSTYKILTIITTRSSSSSSSFIYPSRISTKVLVHSFLGIIFLIGRENTFFVYISTDSILSKLKFI